MSIFRMPTLNNISSRFEGLRDRISRGSRLDSKHQKMRHLALDPLEERQLLSVTPADVTDTLVNTTVNEDRIAFMGFNQYGTSGWDVPQMTAMDDDGDFVVTWTRYDEVIDPSTGDPIIDANIYARYFTDDVQRISLPDELTVNNDDDQYGSFTVKYGGNEVQKINISATHEPYQNGGWNQDNIAGGIVLGFDVNGNGVIGPGESATVFYDETDKLADTALQIQDTLQGLGGALADVTVKPVSPTEYEIHFGDLSKGENQPMITVEGTSFTDGFLPAVQIEALREPVEIGPIAVSPNNPNETATSIEEYFRYYTETSFDIGPIEFQPPSRLNSEAYNLGPYLEPVQTVQGVPTVNVRPVEEYVSFKPDMNDVDGDGDVEEPLPDAGGNPILDTGDLDGDGDVSELQPWFDGEGNQIGEWRMSLTDFEITFDGALGSVEGAAGKKDHPELVLVSAATDLGTSVDIAALGTVRTIKEPSPEFRVNPEEPESPFTPYMDKFAQTDAAVAMDADGNFVITWTSEIRDWQNAGSLTDIYARQFSPVGNDVDGGPGVRGRHYGHGRHVPGQHKHAGHARRPVGRHGRRGQLHDCLG